MMMKRILKFLPLIVLSLMILTACSVISATDEGSVMEETPTDDEIGTSYYIDSQDGNVHLLVVTDPAWQPIKKNKSALLRYSWRYASPPLLPMTPRA